MLVRRSAVAAGALLAVGSVLGAAALTNVVPTGNEAQGNQGNNYPGQGLLDPSNTAPALPGTAVIDPAAATGALDPGTAPPTYGTGRVPQRDRGHPRRAGRPGPRAPRRALPRTVAVRVSPARTAQAPPLDRAVAPRPRPRTVAVVAAEARRTPPRMESSGGLVEDVASGLGDTVDNVVSDTTSTLNHVTAPLNSLLSSDSNSNSATNSRQSDDESSSNGDDNDNSDSDSDSGSDSDSDSGGNSSGLLGGVGQVAAGLLGG